MTPEGRIKKKINAVLASYGSRIYRYMPVPSGYGKPTIDYLLCCEGRFIGIEAKAPGKAPTPRQEDTLAEIESAGGETFVISDDAGVEGLAVWLATPRQ